jgi:hypothetical protein
MRSKNGSCFSTISTTIHHSITPSLHHSNTPVVIGLCCRKIRHGCRKMQQPYNYQIIHNKTVNLWQIWSPCPWSVEYFNA